MELTPEARKAYIQSPNTCPFCGSEEITSASDPTVEEGDEIVQDISCSNCGAYWLDTYTLTGITVIRPPAESEEE